MFASRKGDANAQLLLSELMRASVCDPDDLPDDVVSTNCRVIYRVDADAQARAHLLVHPQDLIFPACELSVMTPVGTALLGLRVGDRMPYGCDRQPGHEVVVEGIGMRFLGEGVPRPDVRTERSVPRDGTAAPGRPRAGTRSPWS